jgi:hypothetical protein
MTSPSVRQQFEDRPDASRLRSAAHAVPLLVFGSVVEYRNETGWLTYGENKHERKQKAAKLTYVRI